MSGATVQTAKEANKALRFAKANSDACLPFRHLGHHFQLCMIAMSNATWGAIASQGGHTTVLANPMWFLIGEATSCLLWVEAVWMQRVKHVQQLWILWGTCYTFGENVGNSNTHCKTWRSQKTEPSCPQQLWSLPKPCMMRSELKYFNYKIKERKLKFWSSSRRWKTVQLKWASSEIQISDGLTKLAARQLLADRLGTHKMSLHWWQTTALTTAFKQPKKKTPKERKDNGRRNALSRGEMSKNLALMIAMSQVHPVVTMAAQMEEHYDMLLHAVCIGVTIAFLFTAYGMVGPAPSPPGGGSRRERCRFTSGVGFLRGFLLFSPLSFPLRFSFFAFFSLYGKWTGEICSQKEREEWRVAARDQSTTPEIETGRGTNPVAPENRAASARRGTPYESPLWTQWGGAFEKRWRDWKVSSKVCDYDTAQRCYATRGWVSFSSRGLLASASIPVLDVKGWTIRPQSRATNHIKAKRGPSANEVSSSCPMWR